MERSWRPGASHTTHDASAGVATPGKRSLTESLPPIQPKADGSISPERAAAAAASAPGDGTPLPEHLRATMERAFEADFSDVRIHQDGAAGAMTAAAFTQGSHIHFAPGRYDPHSVAGLDLIAHELTHVLQQRAGRVEGAQSKGDVLNVDSSLESEADQLGERAARGERVSVPGAASSAGPAPGPQRTAVRQGYLLFNPAGGGGGGGGNVYAPAAGTTFEGQEKVGSSFMNAGVPRINAAAVAPALRISQNGQLAIEDSNLATRQPKHFFALPGSIAAWNEALEAAGSYYRIITIPGETVTFTLPGGGGQQTLVKAQARNLVAGNQGNAMTTIQNCDSMFDEVTGSVGVPSAELANPLAAPLPVAHNATHRSIQEYYVAAELAGTAGVGGATGGMPAGGLGIGAPPHVIDGQLNTVAQNYGNAMNAHLGGAPNGALDARMQHLGVNQYARPEVGQGLVTHSLGKAVPMGAAAAPGAAAAALGAAAAAPGAAAAAPGAMQKDDQYNNRVVANAGNNNLWASHWAGVIARDGADYITLENYARNAEDAAIAGGADPRFYFQMYGDPGQSWHEAWSALNHGGVAGVREFTNPLTMTVNPGDSPAAFDIHAQRNYGAQYAVIKNQHNTVAVAVNADQLTIALLKGLSYANTHLNNRQTGGSFGDWDRISDWRAAVAAALAIAVAPHWSAPLVPLLNHVQTRLDQLNKNPITKLKK